MEVKQVVFQYDVVEGIEQLEPGDQVLMQTARAATANAYAPYSQFFVAATALLSDGSTLSATNQENASYPVGICAERSLLAALSAGKPNTSIQAMAISYRNTRKEANDIPISPCGMCRQSLVEWVERQQQNFRILLSGQNGSVFIIHKATDLLPLNFGSKFLE